MPDSEQPEYNKRLNPVVVVVLYPIALIGRRMLGILNHIGEVMNLLFSASRWLWRTMTFKKYRLGKSAIVSQICRIGVQSIFIVVLVSGSVGLILALQLSPPLDDFGQRDKIANIIAVAVLRELGPLIGAIVLTGFAGASIAAELGTMVVSEEIEALEASALNPVRFLVVPRILAGDHLDDRSRRDLELLSDRCRDGDLDHGARYPVRDLYEQHAHASQAGRLLDRRRQGRRVWYAHRRNRMHQRLTRHRWGGRCWSSDDLHSRRVCGCDCRG
jgi:hypothetical protein